MRRLDEEHEKFAFGNLDTVPRYGTRSTLVDEPTDRLGTRDSGLGSGMENPPGGSENSCFLSYVEALTTPPGREHYLFVFTRQNIGILV
jgi:hypothetical protein